MGSGYPKGEGDAETVETFEQRDVWSKGIVVPAVFRTLVTVIWMLFSRQRDQIVAQKSVVTQRHAGEIEGRASGP